jgi:hypothetical protein
MKMKSLFLKTKKDEIKISKSMYVEESIIASSLIDKKKRERYERNNVREENLLKKIIFPFVRKIDMYSHIEIVNVNMLK